ncbi:MAG: hypothetical protein QXM75_02790 [Candidatus Diapherotrites archaeon]
MIKRKKVFDYFIFFVFAIVTYGATYFISNYVLREFGLNVYNWAFDSKQYNAMYGFAPIAAFVLVFFGLKYWKEYFKESTRVLLLIYFLGIFALLFAFWVNLWFFYSDAAIRTIGNFEEQIARAEAQYGVDISFSASYNVCVFGCTQKSGFGCIQKDNQQEKEIMLICEVNYLSEFYQSAFLPFWLSSIFAGIFFFAYLVMDKKISKELNK